MLSYLTKEVNDVINLKIITFTGWYKKFQALVLKYYRKLPFSTPASWSTNEALVFAFTAHGNMYMRPKTVIIIIIIIISIIIVLVFVVVLLSLWKKCHIHQHTV